MPKYIISLKDEGKTYYMEWSTVVDAPITYGLEWEDFRKEMEFRYRRELQNKLDDILDMVSKNGCSTDRLTVDQIIENNRAGLDEKRLTKQELIDMYCKQ